jgi:AAA15 family ATPase/GTPase
MGDGITRITELYLGIANAPRGIVFWDEIENGVHHSILPKIWQAIDRITKEFDTQFFATTHSLECIKAAHSVFSNHEPYDFAVYRLDRVGEAVKAVRYDKDLLEAAIETQMEIR